MRRGLDFLMNEMVAGSSTWSRHSYTLGTFLPRALKTSLSILRVLALMIFFFSNLALAPLYLDSLYSWHHKYMGTIVRVVGRYEYSCMLFLLSCSDFLVLLFFLKKKSIMRRGIEPKQIYTLSLSSMICWMFLQSLCIFNTILCLRHDFFCTSFILKVIGLEPSNKWTSRITKNRTL